MLRRWDGLGSGWFGSAWGGSVGVDEGGVQAAVRGCWMSVLWRILGGIGVSEDGVCVYSVGSLGFGAGVLSVGTGTARSFRC